LSGTSRAGGLAPLEVDVKAKVYLGASGETRLALRDVAFSLEVGKVGAIVGPSGCGKTTLLRIVAGLDRHFEGAVARPASGRLAFVFQEPRLLPWRTVEENVRIAAPEAGEPALAELFVALGLSEHRRHFPGELSLGLARRVALARALAIRPDLLLLDEPLASLDATTASRLIEEITALVERRPVTTLLVTHDIEVAIRLADVVFVFSDAPARLLARVEIPTPRSRRLPGDSATIARRIEAARTEARQAALVHEPAREHMMQARDGNAT
jgi:sulfonate transport system ATP-binding protein